MRSLEGHTVLVWPLDGPAVLALEAAVLDHVVLQSCVAGQLHHLPLGTEVLADTLLQVGHQGPELVTLSATAAIAPRPGTSPGPLRGSLP
jgi:hypothetical protein